MWFKVAWFCLLVVTIVTSAPLPALLDTKDILSIHKDMNVPITMKQAENEILKLPANKRKNTDKLAYYLFVEYMQELIKSEENTTPVNKADVVKIYPTKSSPVSKETSNGKLILPSSKDALLKAGIDDLDVSPTNIMIAPTTQNNTSVDILNTTMSIESDSVEINQTTNSLDMTSSVKPGLLSTVQYKDSVDPVKMTHTAEYDNSDITSVAVTSAQQDVSTTKSVLATTPQYDTSVNTVTMSMEIDNAELKTAKPTTENFNVRNANVTQVSTTQHNDSFIAITTGNTSVPSDMQHDIASTTVSLTLWSPTEKLTQAPAVHDNDSSIVVETGNATTLNDTLQDIASTTKSLTFGNPTEEHTQVSTPQYNDSSIPVETGNTTMPNDTLQDIASTTEFGGPTEELTQVSTAKYNDSSIAVETGNTTVPSDVLQAITTTTESLTLGNISLTEKVTFFETTVASRNNDTLGNTANEFQSLNNGKLANNSKGDAALLASNGINTKGGISNLTDSPEGFSKMVTETFNKSSNSSSEKEPMIAIDSTTHNSASSTSKKESTSDTSDIFYPGIPPTESDSVSTHSTNPSDKTSKKPTPRSDIEWDGI
ncbi:unnamed protein product [Owenia fusiformis]|uniref:Uncharacterized protein n=1 Tax=Owenia fusiformis TaxID=6347 RepID=A0A8J1XZW9_OWEFU|nr:unnamed protein product [Owenia fusiformis]